MFFDVNVFHLQGASPRKCLPCKIKLMVCIILSPLVREALFLFSVVPQKFHRAELNQTLQPWIGIWIGFAILKDHPAIPKCVLAWQCVTCTRFLVSAASKWSTFYLYCASLISTLSLSPVAIEHALPNHSLAHAQLAFICRVKQQRWPASLSNLYCLPLQLPVHSLQVLSTKRTPFTRNDLKCVV